MNNSAKQSQQQADPAETSYRYIFNTLQWVFIDSLIIFAAYSSAYLMRSITAPLRYVPTLTFIILVIIINTLIFLRGGIYRRLWSQTSGHGVITLLQAALWVSAMTFIIDFFVQPRPTPLSVVLMGNFLAFIGFTSTRYRSRLLPSLQRRLELAFNPEAYVERSRVLIVGAGESGQTLAWRMKHRTNMETYKVIGFIDDDPRKMGMYVENTPVLGSQTQISYLVQKYQIDLLIVAIHNIRGDVIRNILAECEKTNAQIKIMTDNISEVLEVDTHKLLRSVEPDDLIGRETIAKHAAVDLSPVTHKRVLITGAAGSIGSEISRQMVAYAPEVLLLLDNNESALHDLHLLIQEHHPDVKVIPILADVTRADMLHAAFDTYYPSLVFHAAAYKHVPMMELYPNEAVRVNIGGTYRLAEIAREYGVERVVLISTDKAVNPTSVMGMSKRICELLIHSLASDNPAKTHFTVVRFGNVLGSRGSVVPLFNRQISQGGPVTITDPRMTRYFMSIPEASNLTIHAAAMTSGDDIFVLRMGERMPIQDLAARMIRLRGLRPDVDIQIKTIGLRPGEKLFEELYSADEKPQETVHPRIFRLADWNMAIDRDEFLIRVNNLLATDLSHYNKPIEMLASITEPKFLMNKEY